MHQYDPKDLSSDLLTEPASTPNTNTSATPTQKKLITKLKPKATVTVREEQIAKATTQGLQVDFACPVGVAHVDVNNDTNFGTSNGHKHSEERNEILNNAIPHMLGDYNDDSTAFVDCTNQGDDEIDKWEHNNQNNSHGEEDDLIDFDDDSDDDLL